MRFALSRRAASTLVAALAACDPGVVTAGDATRDARPDQASPSDVSVVIEAGPDVAPLPDVLATDAVAMDSSVALTDEATIEAQFFPRSIGCTSRCNASITVRNTGTSTWSDDLGYALGAVGDSDPLHTMSNRVAIGAGMRVAPGETHEFIIPLISPGAAGMVTTDWRMLRMSAAFGAAVSEQVVVSCDRPTVSDFRLADVNVISSPDVRGFPVTSRITELSFNAGTFHIDHTRRGMWPPVVIAPDGTTQEATVWVFFRIAGAWYATGGERLRPNQTDKALTQPSDIGPGWLYDPGRWRIMTGYVPSPGELVGFMVVAGSTRSDNQTPVMERSGVVLVPFPTDGVAASFPPFAWQE